MPGDRMERVFRCVMGIDEPKMPQKVDKLPQKDLDLIKRGCGALETWQQGGGGKKLIWAWLRQLKADRAAGDAQGAFDRAAGD
jgi:hypothetical protein